MQNWNDLIRTQLNNLASFPAKQTWKLGEWTYECHVRPEVANAAALPLVGNELGDVRVSLADQAWYIWDGALWQPMSGGGGAVNSVTASAPLASSGGANPNISLTGIVAAANGGTGIALPGALNNVLTSDGAGGWTSAPPAGGSGAVTVSSTAQEALNAGDLVRFVDDAGTPKVQKADATDTDARLNPVGFAVAAAAAGAAVTIQVAGVADIPAARFDVAPVAADVGKRVFVSTASGKIALAASTTGGDLVQRAGVLTDGGANPKVLVQIGDPTLLV